MNKKSKLKMGIIGVGRMGQYHLNVLSGLNTHQLVGVFDSNQDRSMELASKFETKSYSDYLKLLEDVEAITIAVPTHLHYEISKKALEYDCHVLLEKPMTTKLEEAVELQKIAKSKKKIIQVGHVERFNGAVIELQKIVTDPYLIEARRFSPFTPRIKDTGVILDMLIHDLDIVLNLVKYPVTSFTAMGSYIENENFEDIASLQLCFENGCIATLVGSRVSQNKERIMNITQEKSYIMLNYANQDIEIHRQASGAVLTTKEEIKYSQESFVEKLYVHKDNPLKSQHIHFYECITDNVTPLVPEEKDIETLRIALESIDKIKAQK
ncbi:MAG: Gfo/Idh/MocA family oxidoreductase [Spirochaetia bacterium]|nr:Gfo/Idh/MocA family oxidoreductase [Spirochaetia bacterium]